MITTKDGLIKKSMEVVFERGFNLKEKKYVTIKSMVGLTLQNELNAWSSREKCQAECDTLTSVVNAL